MTGTKNCKTKGEDGDPAPSEPPSKPIHLREIERERETELEREKKLGTKRVRREREYCNVRDGEDE